MGQYNNKQKMVTTLHILLQSKIKWSSYKIDHKRDKVGVFLSIVSTRLYVFDLHQTITLIFNRIYSDLLFDWIIVFQLFFLYIQSLEIV